MTLFLALTMIVASADGDTGGDPSKCGLYCLYAISQYYEKDVQFKSLAKPDYQSDPVGSTLSDLCRAAADIGLHAIPAKGLSLSTLKRCPYPLILAVRAFPESKKLDHYFVALPGKGGRKLILDAAAGREVESEEKLRAQWNGLALVVADKAFSLGSVFWPSYAKLLFLIVAAAGIRILIPRFPAIFNRRMFISPMNSLLRVAVVLLCIVAFPLIPVVFQREGSLLGSSETVAAVQDRHYGTFLPRVTANQLKEFSDGGAVIVDARLQRDFDAGHVPGAINVSPLETEKQIASVMKPYQPAVPIIVYCQSSQCDLAFIVSRNLNRLGFSRIYYYEGGWADWNKNNVHEK